ncbi:serine/threonine-protein kinase SRPK3 [Seiridium cupressi]
MMGPQDNEDGVINTPRPSEDKCEDIQSPDEAQSEHGDSQLFEHVQPEDTPEDIPTPTVEEQYEPEAEQWPATFAQGIVTTNMEISPPPTPPSRAPNDHEWRFKKMTSPCEWIEDYRPGGYHPVHLGDVFKNGEYKILVGQ